MAAFTSTHLLKVLRNRIKPDPTIGTASLTEMRWSITHRQRRVISRVCYLYHNWIDIVGCKLATEDRTTEAAENAIEDLTKLVRKLTTANFSNILITADHGFLYQHRPLDESEFSVADPTGSNILFKNRRFVIGHGLNETAGMKKFTSGQLGLAGKLDILFPNSINRMRIKGAGSRFVHGGATLQEIIIPVLRVGKRREADIGQVDVQIIAPSRNLISLGQTAVALYQAQPISEKQQQRDLLAGIYAQDGTLISDEHQMTFDFTSQNPREREFPVTFLLSREADRFNNQDVFLNARCWAIAKTMMVPPAGAATVSV